MDPIGCREVKDLIIALARRGKTVLLSSHLLADVEDVCDRVVIYYGGRIQAMGTLKELLATPDSLRITTPVLTRPLLERVLELLRQETGPDQVRIETPTQNLESYFLGVVERAKQGETSGATSGHRVAAYLRGGAEAAAPAPDRMLERLTMPLAGPEPHVTVAPPLEAVDETRLAALAGAATAPETPKPAPPKPADLAQADEKLADLLGGKG
jgi:ABC-2 type transport system ATP-binding protein